MRRTWHLYRAANTPSSVLTAVALFAIFTGLVIMTRCFAIDAEGGTSFWPPNGALTIGLLVLPLALSAPLAVACMLSNVAANLAAHYSALDSGLYATLNIFVSVLTALGTRRFCGAATDLSRSRRLLSFALIAIVVSALEAAIGTAIQIAIHDGVTNLYYWLQWTLCDSLGLVISTPAILLVIKRKRYRSACKAGPLEQWLMFGLNIGITATAFSHAHSSVIFLMYPLLLWTAFRAGPVWVLTSVMAMSLVVSAMTAHAMGPLALISAHGALLREDMLQPFLASLVLCALPPNNALGELNRSALRLSRLHAAANAARMEAVAATAAKSQFLANMSHEIRTPLNGLLGMAQAMARSDLSDLQRTRLNVIHDSGEVLMSLLNDLLDVAKIEAGKVRLEMTVFSLETVVQSVHTVFSAMAETKGLVFSCRLAPGVTGLYRGDPTRVRQIMMNLVSNALKFTDAGEVGLIIDPCETGVRLQVFDTGIGIPPDRVSNLFAKFEQVDVSTTRRFGGTGLGLAISRDLAQLMGGDLRVDSVLGQGSRFTVDLALEPVEDIAEAADVSEDPPPQAVAPAGEPLRVLAAEDNLTNQLVLKTFLEQIDTVVVMVGDGEQAVRTWEAGEFDLVLMDMQMPVMDGLTATRAIREAEVRLSRTRTPIIALTADVMAHQIQAYKAAGIDGVVAKPMQFQILIDTLSEVLTAQTPAEQSQVA